jgi:hypothetical protein
MKITNHKRGILRLGKLELLPGDNLDVNPDHWNAIKSSSVVQRLLQERPAALTVGVDDSPQAGKQSAVSEPPKPEAMPEEDSDITDPCLGDVIRMTCDMSAKKAIKAVKASTDREWLHECALNEQRSTVSEAIIRRTDELIRDDAGEPTE